MLWHSMTQHSVSGGLEQDAVCRMQMPLTSIEMGMVFGPWLLGYLGLLVMDGHETLCLPGA